MVNSNRFRFRAWDKVKNKMCGVYVLDLEANKLILDEKSDSLSYWLSFERFDLMQYTGLTDKNGVEIYEGDIVKTTIIEDVLPSGETSEYIETKIVEWDKEQAGFAFAEDSYEVIGNIYENPELLEKE